MPGYNDMFELSVEDMDLIESALRQTKAELSLRAMPEAMDPDSADESHPRGRPDRAADP